MIRDQVVTKNDLKDIKVNDIFRFRWNYDKERFMPYHCFDGQLVAIEHYNDIVLGDTYWGFGKIDQYSHRFKLDEVLTKGELTFICNLDDVEDIIQHNIFYYEEKDIFNLSYQHQCYKKFAKLKNAVYCDDCLDIVNPDE